MENINKEEKKKLRKRDRFWKVVYPHYKQTEKTSSKQVESDQLNKINILSNYAENKISINLDNELLGNLLESNDWDVKKSMLELLDYEEASHGILVEPPVTPDKALLGFENDGGTSCYIDALLFAMYISNTTFDPLLTYDLPPEKDDKIKLQTLLRLFVNKLRKGHFVNADYVHWLRKALQEAKWSGQNEAGNWSQEDTTELFMFITEIFDLPYLPFQIRLFHGANKDSDDDRVMTDRTLTLSIPDNDTIKEVKLQDILVDHFYSSIITGIKRNVDFTDYEDGISENVAASPTIQNMLELPDKDEKYKLKQLLRQTPIPQDSQVVVTAWQVLELLPFYSATNEQGEVVHTQANSSFSDSHMILPIVLKRYRFNNLSSTKMKKRVDIPVTIDFNKFINQNVDDPMCSTCGHQVNWTLHFKSAVCHIGNSPYSGHYISYARVMDNKEDDESFYWLKFDDMNTSNRVTYIMDKNSSSVYNDLAENAYIIFYELDKTCHHPHPFPSNPSSIDEKEAMKLNGTQSPNETDSEEDKKGKSKATKKKHHHHHLHHHHSKGHLKESCRLM